MCSMWGQSGICLYGLDSGRDSPIYAGGVRVSGACNQLAGGSSPHWGHLFHGGEHSKSM